MTKPDLLFIMTDQQRYDALGANGNDIIWILCQFANFRQNMETGSVVG